MSVSDFETMAQNDVAALLDECGVDVSYTPQGGSPRTIKIAFMGETRMDHIAQSNVGEYSSVEILLSSVNDTAGVVTPKASGRSGNAGDSFAHDSGRGSETWYVRDILQDNAGGMHRLGCCTSKSPAIDRWGA